MTIWQTIKENPAVLIWAIIIHALAFIAVGVSFKSSDAKISEVIPDKVIEAVAIDENKIKKEIEKLKKADKRKKREQKRLQDKARKAKRDRRKEEKKLQAIKKKQKVQERVNKEKRDKENQYLADLEEKGKELEQKRKESEQKQKETQEQLNKLEKQRQEKQALLEKEEKERQEKIAEQKRLAEQKKRVLYEQSEVAKYRSLIRRQITDNWILPASYQKGMKCKVLVRLIPSGEVISVRVSQSSGHSAFDRSVEMAVEKASPLPVPKSSTRLFDHFREVEFVFDPNEKAK